ncbi:MAG: hypothetical protein EXS19_01560 [Pedosphaera sp.]|nr:hypothetical protein [Pedosphaera sp.]
MTNAFAIKPASRRTVCWFNSLMVLLGIIAGVPVSLAARESESSLWFGAAVVGFVMLLIGYGAHAARHATIEISPDSFRVRGDIYSRRIPLRELLLEEARVVDFAVEPDLRPKWKLCGTALPGHQAGFFSLHNGQRAYVFLTDTVGVVHLRTRAGGLLLLSPMAPENFLAALRAQCQQGEAR